MKARSRPSAQQIAMAVAALWLVAFSVLHATTGVMVFSLFSLAPLIAATAADARRTAVFAGAAVALTVWAEWWQNAAADVTYWTRVGVVGAISAMAVVVAGIRRRREERLARMTGRQVTRRRRCRPCRCAGQQATGSHGRLACPGDDLVLVEVVR